MLRAWVESKLTDRGATATALGSTNDVDICDRIFSLRPVEMHLADLLSRLENLGLMLHRQSCVVPQRHAVRATTAVRLAPGSDPDLHELTFMHEP